MHRVAVTGLGIISPIGRNVAENWASLVAGINNCRELPNDYSHLPCRIGCCVPEEVLDDVCEAVLHPRERKSMSRASVLLMAAVCEAVGFEEGRRRGWNKHRVGVSIGTGFDGSAATDGHKRIGPYALTRALGNMPAAHISVRFKLGGPSRSINTACAAGLHSIGDAFRMVRSGECDAVIAGGTEAAISPWSVEAFSRIRALTTRHNADPGAASRPFDVDRCGFVISEGAGALVLERLDQCNRENVLAEIIGFGQAADGEEGSLVAPSGNVENGGPLRAMKAAFNDAGMTETQVGYVNAHATSTPLGDTVECAAIAHLSGSPLIGSFKGQLGHCLGGAGSMESVLTVLALYHRLLPPNTNLHQPDPTIKVNLLPGQPIRWPDDQPLIALKNSFGFGGTNASLLIRALF